MIVSASEAANPEDGGGDGRGDAHGRRDHHLFERPDERMEDADRAQGVGRRHLKPMLVLGEQ